MKEWAYVNGEWSAPADARVSVQDRGFLFADGVYEVIMAYNRRPFRLREHLARLRASADGIRLPFDFDSGALEAIVEQGIGQCTFDDVHIYLQLTRGVAPRGHAFPGSVSPTVVATFRERQDLPASVREDGYRAITVPDPRWANCYIKSVALLPNVLARQQAIDAGVNEAIFVGQDGDVLEAASANVFALIGDALVTPPLGPKLLAGITRAVVIECAERLSIPVEQRRMDVRELQTAREVLLTSTAAEVAGVVEVDGTKIGDGAVGPITQKLAAEFARVVRQT